MSEVMQNVNDKVEKLWKLLAEHNKALGRYIQIQKEAITSKDFEKVGDASGDIQMVAQSDVCYATLIEVLEDLRKAKTSGVGG